MQQLFADLLLPHSINSIRIYRQNHVDPYSRNTIMKTRKNRGGRKMKTGDLVIYKGLVNPNLNLGMVAEEATHKMLIWDEEHELTFWWEPLPAIIEGHVYKFGFTLKNLRNNKIECEEQAERNLTIEELHCATVGIIRDVWGES